MNRDTVIALAREAGLWPAVTDVFPKELERFAALVAAAERAKCAHLVASQNRGNGVISEETRQMLKWCAAAIRNRDNQVSLQPSNQGVNHE